QPFIFIPEERPSGACRSMKYKAVEALGPLSTTLGACTLAGFTVITDEIAGQTWALRRLFHSLVQRLSAFFIMLIGFERVACPKAAAWGFFSVLGSSISPVGIRATMTARADHVGGTLLICSRQALVRHAVTRRSGL